MDILLIILLTLLNGAFAMSELALTASRKVRLQTMVEVGDKGAKAALALLDNPTQFLSTVQVGITSIGMLNAIVGEAAFSDGVAAWLQATLQISAKASEISATAFVVTCITFVTILFGELVPKRIGQLYPEAVARLMSRPMTWVAIGAKPFVRLLSVATVAILKLLRIDTSDNRAVTEAEITASLEEGVDAGIIEEHEHQMVRNVFHLDDRPLTSMMLPRSDIEWLDANLSVAQCLLKVSTAGDKGSHSWYPVCRGSLDDVIGQISVGRLLSLRTDEHSSILSQVEPAVFVPETLSGMELIEQFRVKAARMVFVVDEYGVVQGLLTPHDLLEAITGELHPSPQTQAWATALVDGSWVLDGLMPVGELKARLDIDEDLPQEDRGRYNTLAGLLMSVSGHMPMVGEVVICAHWRFEVTELEGRRIEKVLARRTI
ncbi:hemolysin family protein [Rhodoferax aquaticus]|uniref:HlyC/CorC family transporter n=1 Tax=Rhodoferax aquaticus TaxID=2527691 RepID=A0A515EMH7_9BURK|nr:hemolysin family protein [Rhodoferax aquaticus]QDL53849.1 HlyC/CorC family transporter [Rhodoferax aquaticus]